MHEDDAQARKPPEHTPEDEARGRESGLEWVPHHIVQVVAVEPPHGRQCKRVQEYWRSQILCGLPEWVELRVAQIAVLHVRVDHRSAEAELPDRERELVCGP